MSSQTKRGWSFRRKVNAGVRCPPLHKPVAVAPIHLPAAVERTVPSLPLQQNGISRHRKFQSARRCTHSENLPRDRERLPRPILATLRHRQHPGKMELIVHHTLEQAMAQHQPYPVVGPALKRTHPRYRNCYRTCDLTRKIF